VGIHEKNVGPSIINTSWPMITIYWLKSAQFVPRGGQPLHIAEISRFVPPNLSPFPGPAPPRPPPPRRRPPLTPPMASSSENTGAPTEEPQAPQPPASNPSEEAEGPQTLDRAQELFDQGSKAIEDGDFVEAVDCLSRALEIRSDSELPPFSRVRV
jgi:hypothetical protein